jgi:hypothetical protein
MRYTNLTKETRDMAEIRVYVIDHHNAPEIAYDFDETNHESIMAYAEAIGSVYSLEGFQNAFNNQEVNTATDLILIK